MITHSSDRHPCNYPKKRTENKDVCALVIK